MAGSIEDPGGEKKRLMAKCGYCMEVWKCGTLPMDISAFIKLGEGIRCPGCNNGNEQIYIWQFDGPADAQTTEEKTGG